MLNAYLINGRREVCLTPFDRGLSYGDGVFRTFPVRGRKPDCWDLHFRRLNEDCNALGIVCPPASVLLADISALCDISESVIVKIIVTRGEGARGYAVPQLSQPNRIVTKSELPNYPEQHFSEGIRLQVCDLRLAQQPRLAGIKHLNRLENVLARMEWVDAQISDGVLLDDEGHVIECTMSNLFIRVGESLITPDLTRCGVAGVTRQRIIDIAPSLGYNFHILEIDINMLLSADEVIICNSLFGAWQVRQIDETYWPAGILASRLRSRLKVQDDA